MSKSEYEEAIANLEKAIGDVPSDEEIKALEKASALSEADAKLVSAKKILDAAEADYQKAYEESKKVEVKKSPNTADPSNIGFYAFIALGTLAFAGSISYKIKWIE